MFARAARCYACAMTTTKRFLAVMCACALLGACAPQSEAIRTGKRSRGPQAGTWEGTWTNKKAGTSGTARVTVMEYPGFGYAFYEVTGDPFGCGEPMLTGTLMLTPGIDFTTKSLTLDISDPILGQLSLDSKGHRVRGGTSGACGGSGPSWDTKTKFRTRKVSGKILLDAGGETSKVSYKVKPSSNGHGPSTPGDV